MVTIILDIENDQKITLLKNSKVISDTFKFPLQEFILKTVFVPDIPNDQKIILPKSGKVISNIPEPPLWKLILKSVFVKGIINKISNKNWIILNILLLLLIFKVNYYFNCIIYTQNSCPYLLATLLLLATKSKKNIRIYQNYCKLNNIIIKNQYPLLLIKKTFNTLYYIKVYIKLNIITIFNKLRIIEDYK
ncbi:uncharacterized protein EAE98_008158 [Botrytis deweyae]|uniref:Uncharacterized protein n=1 Tax=Botrytis deweyae TaxID=2478750 RepID=A0ABQ7IFV2_9HELO|nr:uncharacterized protein EAE98_008158 [Botrytis deweyae]KAF7922632.1 hypothetical protein EAE98_008158 [Botrytis deweyae]